MDVASMDRSAPVCRVERKAGGEPLLECAWQGMRRHAGRGVSSVEASGGSAVMCPPRPVVHGRTVFDDVDSGSEVRQMKESSRSRDDVRILRVEAEKPDARWGVSWPGGTDVCPDVDLAERAQAPGQGPALGPDTGHPERDYADPGLAVEQVQF